MHVHLYVMYFTSSVVVHLHDPSMLQPFLRCHSLLGIPVQTSSDEVQKHHIICFDGSGKFTGSGSTLAAFAIGNAARVSSGVCEGISAIIVLGSVKV